jgi:excisionase family DNA binding protein
MTDYFTSWDELPLLLTTDEAAAILRVHINTVKYLIHSEQLSATKVGRSWRIPRESVEAIATCDTGMQTLARDLITALEPFSQLLPIQGQVEATYVIPSRWIEDAQSVVSRARRMGFAEYADVKADR